MRSPLPVLVLLSASAFCGFASDSAAADPRLDALAKQLLGGSEQKRIEAATVLADLGPIAREAVPALGFV